MRLENSLDLSRNDEEDDGQPSLFQILREHELSDEGAMILLTQPDVPWTVTIIVHKPQNLN